MKNYAQINSENICFAIVTPAEHIEGPHIILLNDGEFPLGHKWENNGWVELPPPPPPQEN